jgi:hypothetical protein
VVYMFTQRSEEDRALEMNLPVAIDPTLLRVARDIYNTYYEVHPNVVERPSGVAIERSTYRGKLIFSSRPILLPREIFVPIHQIESELY